MKRIANTELLRLADLLAAVLPRWVVLPQASRLTSTDWDGDARSTTSATKIDMSSVFSGYPTGPIDAVLLYVAVRDSASAANTCNIRFDNAAPTTGSPDLQCVGVNDKWHSGQLIVPVDAAGDVYFDCTASGSGTLDVILQVHGWHLK